MKHVESQEQLNQEFHGAKKNVLNAERKQGFVEYVVLIEMTVAADVKIGEI